MESSLAPKSPFKPVVVLLMVFGLAVCFQLVFPLVGMLVSMLIYGISFQDLSQNVYDYPAAALTMQGIGTLGAFIIPAIAYCLMTLQLPGKGLNIKRAPHPILSALVVCIAVAGTFGALQAATQLNTYLTPPDTWAISDVIHQMQEKTNDGYKAMLNFSVPGRFIGCLFVMAVFPAVAEEFFFRGALQPLFHKITKNIHLAIFITAFIFSVIHLQWDGFFPRLVLGLLFGYLYHWTKNLWYPIIAHFVNNGLVVVAAFITYKNDGEFSFEETGQVELPVMIGGTIIFLGVCWLFKFILQKISPTPAAQEEVKTV